MVLGVHVHGQNCRKMFCKSFCKLAVRIIKDLDVLRNSVQVGKTCEFILGIPHAFLVTIFSAMRIFAYFCTQLLCVMVWCIFVHKLPGTTQWLREPIHGAICAFLLTIVSAMRNFAYFCRRSWDFLFWCTLVHLGAPGRIGHTWVNLGALGCTL